MTKSREQFFDQATGSWRRTTRYDKKRPKRPPGRPQQWHYKTVTGKWRILLLKKCRETGYIHTTGTHAGHPNYWRLAIETGIHRNVLYDILKTGTISMSTLGKLCDAFHCQPNDFIQRITTDSEVTPSTDLPDLMQDDDLPGDEYVRPSQL